jgi:hypothetical protein
MAEALPDIPRPGKGDLQDPDECVREMTAAGFRDVSARHFTASMHFESAEAYVDGCVRSIGPVALRRKMDGESAWLEMREKLLNVLRPRFSTGPKDLTAEAIFTLGRR